MKNKRILMSICLCFCCLAAIFGSNDINYLLLQLDQVINQAPEYDQQKEKRIAQLKVQLSKTTSDEDIYSLYSQLFGEYEAYICDSAMVYVKLHLQLAEQKYNTYWICECKLRLARIYAAFARFSEAEKLLHSIPRSDLSTVAQMAAYYNRLVEVYTYWGENTDGKEAESFNQLKNNYLDSLLTVLPPDSYDYQIQYGIKLIELKEFGRAEDILLPCLAKETPDSRGFAMQTSLIARLYEAKGDERKQIEYLIQSTIADVKSSVKENTSMRQLALYLMENGDVDRANRYIKKSLDDANFYNARMRTVQIARVLPVIDKTYQLQREQHQYFLSLAIYVIGFLLLILIGVVIYLFRQMRKLAKARKEIAQVNKALQKTNERLIENHQIKEEYIGHFLNQCSIYLDKLEAYRKSLNKKAAKGQIDELYSALKSSQVIDDELRDFYQHFDTTFINLFPNFVEEFNKLLPETERSYPKYPSELTIELRIFALIRLGIIDSAKIARFLRYSITTIYNYRSRYRNIALVPKDKFEEAIMKIGYANQ
ncbi:MAG: DUF6377 domain-containing protein [Dysgonamonadaceae bacterium]|nr:DUF6377 domain-containing protein [Dysgonamonadaceae bacterium]